MDKLGGKMLCSILQCKKTFSKSKPTHLESVLSLSIFAGWHKNGGLPRLTNDSKYEARIIKSNALKRPSPNWQPKRNVHIPVHPQSRSSCAPFAKVNLFFRVDWQLNTETKQNKKRHLPYSYIWVIFQLQTHEGGKSGETMYPKAIC